MTPADKCIAVDFRRSFVHTVTLGMSFVAIAEDYEGFDPWIYTTRAGMSPDLRADLELLFNPFATIFLLRAMSTSLPDLDTMPAMIRWLGEIDDALVLAASVASLRKLAAEIESDVPESIVEDGPALDALLSELAERDLIPSNARTRLAPLLMQPEEMRAEIVFLATRFWDRHMAAEMPRCREIEQRSIDHYAGQTFFGSAEEIFTALTGRGDYPAEQVPPTDRVKRMIFIPSCHCGPYASISDVHGDGTVLAVTYNCRPSAGSDNQSALPTERIFPPLRGLADETRLAILALLIDGELYAQQIVDRMPVSQSAVSRHLRLLVACGILRERRQEGMKFYTINDATIADLIRNLERLRSRSRD